MRPRSYQATTESESSSSHHLVVTGSIAGMVILASVVAGQPAGWWGGLGVALIFLWQFAVPRVSRGHVGGPELQRVISSSAYWCTSGRKQS